MRKATLFFFYTIAALRHDTHGAGGGGKGWQKPFMIHWHRRGRAQTTDCSGNSVRFLMLDLNVGVETVEERLLAVHYTSNWKSLAVTLPWALYGTRAGVLYFKEDTLSNMLAVQIILRTTFSPVCVLFRSQHDVLQKAWPYRFTIMSSLSAVR